ncbi:MAG: tRNA (adenosine(37)-N6)-threonylcarbamoyltransferase complex ATPase subunit type 1 TsaE [Candidatus Pacebacteria bacterium]|nr:tRNA (adenosine(37)-N6)-threonylcarbamoyltransferase complex ATPase subunit type 1 TsaE [Candidatus Paceibacterota bacterium]
MKHEDKKDMMTPMNHVSYSPEDTQRFAREQALLLIKEANGQPLVIALEGELGAGKTTFTQAFAKALGVKENLKSPTFVLMKHYSLKDIPNYQTLYHFDCYRLNSSADLIPLGTKEIINQPGVIVLMEWAERVGDILPRNHWVIKIEHVSEQQRNISVAKVID